MTTVFIKILNMSIAAGWLVLAVILLRLILKNAPKWICCILWGLVAVRLICPISIESIFSLLPSRETIPQNIIYAEKPIIHTGVMAVNSMVNPYLSESMAPNVGDSVNPMQVAMSLGAVIWVAGMIGMLVYMLISYLRIRNRVAVSLPVRENIYLCDYIDTPFVLGFIHPQIYLPSAMAEDDKAEFVIAHEKAHIRRRDHWWKPLGFLLLTVYWFHPLIWIAYMLLCRDIELACDEHVIGNLKEKDKKAYSDALLSCSIHMNNAGFPHSMISACPLAFGEVGVKDRVKAVLHYKKPAFWLVLMGVLACIVAAICFLTDPADRELHAPEPFGHSYRVEEVVYANGSFSFTYTKDTAPRYSFSSDYVMHKSTDRIDDVESNDWVQLDGKFEEVKLTPKNFDQYLSFLGLGEDGPVSVFGINNIRKNAENVWRIDIEDDTNGVFYYLILSKQGDVYLTYGYDFTRGEFEKKEGSLIRWIFKLTRTDILDCDAVSEDCHSYVQPTYYPEGFDWNYDRLTNGYINQNGVLCFTADWDTDTLIVSEDYYKNYHPNNRSGSTIIEKETYTLERNKNGQFELNVELRSTNGDMAVYFVEGPVGVYVFKIIFVENEAQIDVLKSENSIILKEPPTLTIICNKEQITALKGTCSWNYQREDGTGNGIEVDSMHPLECKEYMQVLPLKYSYQSSINPLLAALDFSVPPDEVTIRYWSTDCWNDTSADSKELEVKVEQGNFSDKAYTASHHVQLLEGDYVYLVTAKWNSHSRYGGTANYSFYTNIEDFTTSVTP